MFNLEPASRKTKPASEIIIEAASQANEPKAKPKDAPKRKLGHRITRNGSTKATTEAAPKPAVKRRMLQPNICPPPPPTHTQDPQDPFLAAPQDRMEDADDVALYVTYDREKDILDLCPNGFDEILQVLVLKNRTKAASRARTRCGSNQ